MRSQSRDFTSSNSSLSNYGQRPTTVPYSSIGGGAIRSTSSTFGSGVGGASSTATGGYNSWQSHRSSLGGGNALTASNLNTLPSSAVNSKYNLSYSNMLSSSAFQSQQQSSQQVREFGQVGIAGYGLSTTGLGSSNTHLKRPPPLTSPQRSRPTPSSTAYSNECTEEEHSSGLANSSPLLSQQRDPIRRTSTTTTSGLASNPQHQQQIVSAIREQIHSLTASTASASPQTSLLPGPALSPSPSASDQGSDDDISDAPSPQEKAQTAHARPTSAVSAHLGERLVKQLSLDDSPPPTSSQSKSGLTQQRQSSPPPPTGSNTSSKQGGRAASNTAQLQSQTTNSYLANKSSLTSPAGGGGSTSQSPPALNPSDILIHVCDENRGLNQDFTCDRALLVCGMKYFQSYLTTPTANGPMSNEEIDISVHCDIFIFQWLLNYIQWERSQGLLDLHDHHRKSKSSTSTPKPVLDVNNVISILISSDFLQMSRLVNECLQFVRHELVGILRTPVDLKCLSEPLLERLSVLFDDDEDSFNHDGDNEREDDRHSKPAIPSGLKELIRISAADTRQKIASKLWRMKLERLLLARMKVNGSNYTLQLCQNCGMKFWTESGIQSEEKSNDSTLSSGNCPSSSSRHEIDFHGVLVAPHVPSPSWSLQKHLLALRVSQISWEACWWLGYGIVHHAPAGAPCVQCGQEGFPYSQMRSCRYHDKEPIQTRKAGTSQLIHPCCNQPALPFSSHQNGCKTRIHVIHPQSRRDKNIYEVVMKNIDAITWKEVESNSHPVDDPIAPKKGISFSKEVSSKDIIPGSSKLAPSILGPSLASTLASYSSSKRRGSSSKLKGSDESDDERRAPSSYESGADSDASRGSDANWSENQADGSDEEDEFEDDEDEDSDGEEDSRRHRHRRTVLTPAQKLAAQTERLKFRRGYEGNNPHGHPPSVKSSNRTSSATSNSNTQSTMVGARMKLNSTAEKALAQLRDVLPQAEFEALTQSLTNPSIAPSRPGASSTNPTKRAQSASAIRVTSSNNSGSIGRRTAVTSQAPVVVKKQPKSILKSNPTTTASVVIPSVQASTKLSELTAVWGQPPTPTSAAPSSTQARGSPDGSPSRSPFNAYANLNGSPTSSTKKKSSTAYQLDYLLEDDRQRMTNLISNLTQNRAPPSTSSSSATSSGSTHHGRSASTQMTAPQVRTPMERVQSAQPRRPNTLTK